MFELIRFFYLFLKNIIRKFEFEIHIDSLFLNIFWIEISFKHCEH